MKVIGSTIRKNRLKLGLSQRALATDICTQATISLIENNCECKNGDILEQICRRMNLSVAEVTNRYSYGDRVLEEAEAHLFNCQIDQAEEKLATLKKERITTSRNIDRFNLCTGFIQLIKAKDADEAIFIFNEIIRRNNFNEAEHYIAWCYLGIGRAYLKKGQLDRASKFYELALSNITTVSQFKRMEILRVIDVYSALVRSAILTDNWELAAEISRRAIRMLGQKQSLYRLKQLLEYNCHANHLLKRPMRAKKMALMIYSLQQLHESCQDINQAISKFELPDIDQVIQKTVAEMNK